MTAHLEQWELIKYLSNPYKVPELWSNRLTGFVTGHPNHEDGTFITTSRLEMLDTPNYRARTFNREYTLGKPNPKWAKWCISQGCKIEDYQFLKDESCPIIKK